MNAEFIVYPILAFALSYFGQKIFIKYASHKKLVDIPNNRSSHTIPKPRGGGLVVYLLALCFLALNYLSLQSSLFSVLLVASTCVALVGFKDDLNGVSIKVRLLIHLLAALLVSYFCYALVYDSVSVLSAATFLVCTGLIIFCINVYNFMDGIDGICGGCVWAISIWMSVLLFLKSDFIGFNFCVQLACILAGFLFFNWPPAKVFMGDVGSGFLGLFISSFYLINFGVSANTIIVFCILNSAFFGDALWTLFVRILRREKFYLSHRQHAYQHASLKFNSHKKVSAYYISYTFFVAGPLATVGFLSPKYLALCLFAAYLPQLKWLIDQRAGFASE